MEGGVRQGCPLSPLLFVVCVDILLRMIASRTPHSTSRAFADDIATIIEDWSRDCRVLHNIFDEFGTISNLHLNTSKTVCIPLWPKDIEEAKNPLDRKCQTGLTSTSMIRALIWVWSSGRVKACPAGINLSRNMSIESEGGLNLEPECSTKLFHIMFLHCLHFYMLGNSNVCHSM